MVQVVMPETVVQVLLQEQAVQLVQTVQQELPVIQD
jgi:hypothetical protein